MIIKNKGKRKEKKRKKYYEAVEELEVDGRIAAVETGRVAKGVEEVVQLFVGGSTVEELEVDGRVAAVEAGRLTEGVDEKVAEGVDERKEQFVGGCIPVVPLINSIISSQKNSLLTFSNICGRTSHRIYRLALPLLSPETLSSSSKLWIFLYNAHLWMTQLPAQTNRHLVK